MAKTGKLLALIGAICTLLGTFFFTLLEGPLVGYYVNGIAGITNIPSIIQAAVSGGNWASWVLIVCLFLYLLSGFIQLWGIKSRIAAFFGSLLPLTAAIFVILLIAGVPEPFFLVVFLLGAAPLVPNVIPLTFEYSFMSFGLGTILIALGSLLALVSVFMTREDY
jgi:hypothetical protein